MHASDGGKRITCSWTKVVCTNPAFHCAFTVLIPATEGGQEQVGEPDADAAARLVRVSRF